MLRTFILFVAFLLLLTSIAIGSEMPTPIPMTMADFDKQVAPIKLGVTKYRTLSTWKGTFRVETTYTDAYNTWRRAETKQDRVPVSGAHLVTVDMTSGIVTLGLLDKDGKVVTNVAGDGDDLDQIKELVLLTGAGNSWDYYSSDKDCYVKFSTVGWTAVHFGKNYVVAKIELADFSVNGPDYTVFSDYRLDATGRWTAWKMVDTLLVPKTDIVGIVTTITVESFQITGDSTKVDGPAPLAQVGEQTTTDQPK